MKKFNFNLGQQVMIALLVGIGCGLFFGEYCSILKVVGDAVIQLIQITVLPYIMLSLFYGIGSLSGNKARSIAVTAVTALALFWGIGLLVIFLVPSIIPNWETASFYSNSAVASNVNQVNFLDIYIPANIFHSLSNNFVPAVVLFSILGGIALMNIQGKEEFMHSLKVCLDALTKMTNYVAVLLPIGIFAIAANAAGTMYIDEFDRLKVYFAMYVLAAVLLTFWIVPMVLRTCTPFKYRDIIGTAKSAFITAFAAGNLFIILPILTQRSKLLMEKYGMRSKESDSMVDILLPVIFCFPLLGKLILLLFIVFAGWYSGNALSVGQYPSLAFSGLFAMFGHDVVAIQFLMDIFKIPFDLFQMYLLTSIVSARFSTLLDAVMLFVVITLSTCAIMKLIKIRLRMVLRYIWTTALVLFISLTAMKFVLNTFVDNQYDKDRLLAGMKLSATQVKAVVHKSLPASDGQIFKQEALPHVLEKGVLRVGYNPTRLPFSFFNGQGELVGFDIDMAHALAGELGVDLEFYPVDEENIKSALDQNLVDIVMAATPLSSYTLSQLLVSDPYLNLTVAVVVPDYLRHGFTDIEDIRAMKGLKIAVVQDKFLQETVAKQLPNAEIKLIKTTGEFFMEHDPEWLVLLTTAEEGAAWSLLYPEYQIVVPEPVAFEIPLVYPVASHDPRMAQFVSLWIEIQKKYHVVDWLYDYWVHGKGAEKKTTRWSIIHDVLHAVK